MLGKAYNDDNSSSVIFSRSTSSPPLEHPSDTIRLKGSSAHLEWRWWAESLLMICFTGMFWRTLWLAAWQGLVMTMASGMAMLTAWSRLSRIQKTSILFAVLVISAGISTSSHRKRGARAHFSTKISCFRKKRRRWVRVKSKSCNEAKNVRARRPRAATCILT